MKTKIKCKKCKNESVIIENQLFFSEEPKKTKIYCPICDNVLSELKTDGWFFVQTIEQHEIDKIIEKQKETLKYKELNI